MAPPSTSEAHVANKLALAMVEASDAPLLLLDENLAVIAASASFCQSFGIDPSNLAGTPFLAIGSGEWNVPQLRSLLAATASGDAEVPAYETVLRSKDKSDRTLVIKVKSLDYGSTETVCLLVTVADVTDARAADRLKDDLLREKAILLQEVQHRVANSLQIIASVLLQNARKVNSTESKGHLQDAHNRVMSVAAVQQQLAASTLGDVKLNAYFTRLCDSIGASMIRDHDQLTLGVSVDESVTSAERSVSLGLIVTELVINALKHAFPGHRRGRIIVGYHSDGADWKLSVVDNGVGMPTGAATAKAGLGTNIVEALARQLHARVEIAAGDPGTRVSVIHAPGSRRVAANAA